MSYRTFRQPHSSRADGSPWHTGDWVEWLAGEVAAPSVGPDEVGVCRLCHGPTDLDPQGQYWPRCFPCSQRHRHLLTGVVPICYSVQRHLESMIWRAKHTTHQEWLRLPLGSLLAVFLNRHLGCIEHRFGRLDILTVVPSHPHTRGGDDHLKALHRSVASWPQSWDLDLLTKTRPDSASDRRQEVDYDLFTLTPRRSVAGGRVVVVDDTFTSGSTLASAAAALRRAGATDVVGLPLGRQVNPNRSESREFLGRLQLEQRGLDLSVCAVHDHQPADSWDPWPPF